MKDEGEQNSAIKMSAKERVNEAKDRFRFNQDKVQWGCILNRGK